ncbi:hypothetical protein ACFOD1_03835 [Pseudidiomarina halophila]|uniref:Uncharacterized protein n=1 Tax=Pseudidiomarina halophila TaxID=1449799 RepID=A0A432XZD3_9GAMM|nr:hypothetical protein [Pseudidiomarina halophila]RUO54076.1 hypothetical protein CWI69_01185 [Pseudidiomarina halophila]
MRSNPGASKAGGYLILEWVIAISCLAGFALLVLSLLQLREPLIARQHQQREQLQQNYQQQQQLLQTADQRWLLEMQRGQL